MASKHTSNYSALHKHLMANYDKLVKPDYQVRCKVGFTLSNLDYIMEKGMVNCSGWLFLSWKDERFSWDPKTFSGIKQMHIPSSEVWIPDVTIYEVLGKITSRYPEYISDSCRVLIFPTGEVLYVPPFSCTVPCNPERAGMTAELSFGSWVYSTAELALEANAKEIDTNPFMSKKVSIKSTRAELKDKTYSGVEDIYHVLKCSLVFTMNEP